MAVTKEQLARWNKNFEDKYPEKKSSQTTTATARQVSDAQMNQWERGYQTMQKSRTAGTSTRQAGNGSTAGRSTGTGSSLGGQVLAQMMGSTNPKLQLAVPKNGTGNLQAYPGKNGIVQPAEIRGGTEQPEWLGKAGSSTPAAQVRGTVKPTEKKR